MYYKKYIFKEGGAPAGTIREEGCFYIQRGDLLG